MKVDIDKPHGIMRDADGKVVLKFGNWEPGEHDVPDAVEAIEYVNGPADHGVKLAEEYRTNPAEKYRPERAVRSVADEKVGGSK